MAEGESMAANGYTLVIGDKNLSSWSLRPRAETSSRTL